MKKLVKENLNEFGNDPQNEPDSNLTFKFDYQYFTIMDGEDEIEDIDVADLQNGLKEKANWEDDEFEIESIADDGYNVIFDTTYGRIEATYDEISRM